MLALRTVLHPTDFTDSSATALHLARSLARDHGGRLLILHVAHTPPTYVGEGMVVPQTIDMAALQGRLDGLAKADASIPTECILVEGDPVSEILSIADSRDCDLIVVGSHGRRGLSRLIMGSVAEQVIRQAKCNVVVAKAAPLEKDVPLGDDITGVGPHA